MSRPDPDREAPPGYRLEASRLSPAEFRPCGGGKCRRSGCTVPAVGEVFRTGCRSTWWKYCGEHLWQYGKWVEDGSVWSWRLIPDESTLDQEQFALAAVRERRERQERRDLRKSLEDLVEAVRRHLAALDREMKLPSTVERGQRIAKLCNALETAKDLARYGPLGIDFRTDARRARA